MPYTIHQAKTHLSKLIRKAQNGENIVITRGKEPVAELRGVKRSGKKRVPGRWKGKIRILPSFFDPMTKEELAEWGIK
jgi:prevent-host-death family protein